MKVNLGALGLGLILAGGAFASTVTLTPGSATGSPGSGTVPSNGTTFSGTLIYNSGVESLVPGVGSSVSATVDEMIYRTAGGTLDFYYQVTNNQTNGSDNLRLITLSNFTGFTTAVAYNTSSGAVAPSDAFRSVKGDTINFDFLTAGGASTLGTDAPYGLGSTTYWLEVDTNATTYAPVGFVAAQDSGNASILAMSPAVPEPMTMGLLGGGLAFLGLARWRKSRKS